MLKGRVRAAEGGGLAPGVNTGGPAGGVPEGCATRLGEATGCFWDPAAAIPALGVTRPDAEVGVMGFDPGLTCRC